MPIAAATMTALIPRKSPHAAISSVSPKPMPLVINPIKKNGILIITNPKRCSKSERFVPVKVLIMPIIPMKTITPVLISEVSQSIKATIINADNSKEQSIA